VGVHPDPGRAAERWHPSLGYEDPHAASSGRPRPGSSPWRPQLERVPASPSAGILALDLFTVETA
jgi:hypothetical protein